MRYFRPVPACLRADTHRQAGGCPCRLKSDFLSIRVAQNQEKYKKEYDAMIKTYDETKFKYEQLEIESSQQAAKHQMIKDYINTLKKQNKPLTKFDGLMWGSLLESATIKDKDTIVFKFKDGTEING
jgi:site-specific DNA recombinase